MMDATPRKPKPKKSYQEKQDAAAKRAFKALKKALAEGGYGKTFVEACKLSEAFDRAVEDARATDALVASGAEAGETPEGHAWSRSWSRRLVRGDVVRVRGNVRDSANYGVWWYAVCTGEGNGCNPEGPGTGVFVFGRNASLAPVLALAAKARAEKTREEEDGWEKWQTSMGIQVLERGA